MNSHYVSVAETRIDEAIGFLLSALLRFLQKDFGGISLLAQNFRKIYSITETILLVFKGSCLLLHRSSFNTVLTIS